MSAEELTKIVREQYERAQKICETDPDGSIGPMRSALEAAVKLFWLKKYGKIPTWIKDGQEVFNLYEAISDQRFSSCFGRLFISDLHAIRKFCNEMIHTSTGLSASEIKEMLERLGKRIREIGEKIGIKIFKDLPIDPTQGGDTNGGNIKTEGDGTSGGGIKEKRQWGKEELYRQPVRHKIYGAGVITSVEEGSKDEKILKVWFSSTIKTLSFPGSFLTKFLEFSDPEMQRKFEEDFGGGKGDDEKGTDSGNTDGGQEGWGEELLKHSAKHKTYGEGVIISVKGRDNSRQEKIVEIKFSSIAGPFTSTFSFPEQFREKVLRFSDKGMQRRFEEEFCISKTEAIQLCRKNGVSLFYEVTFSSKNSGFDLYWANPPLECVDGNWSLILNDTRKAKLYIFNIPAHSIAQRSLVVRSDKPNLFDLQIYYGDSTYQDSRSGVRFAGYLTATLDY